MATSETDVSVVICTRNRSSLLARVCEAALGQQLQGRGWELVIVDNGSTDGSLQIARSIESTAGGRVRVTEAPELGLSAARNAGIAVARGELVIFLDDDALPFDGWLAGLVRSLEHDGAHCAGGPVIPEFQGELPDWFLGRYLPYLSAWDLGGKPRRLTYNEYPRGANIGFRREVFDRLGGFSTRLGRKGRKLLSCEEIELCFRIERAGWRILYEPCARVRHLVNADRISRRWLRTRFGAQGQSEAIIDWRHGGASALGRGLKSHLRRWRESGQGVAPDEVELARCHRAALGGYVRAMLPAILTVTRWQPPGQEPSGGGPRVQ